MNIAEYIQNYVPFSLKRMFVRGFDKWKKSQGFSEDTEYDKEDLDILLNKIKLGRW